MTERIPLEKAASLSQTDALLEQCEVVIVPISNE
jgi:hypothetical protein